MAVRFALGMALLLGMPACTRTKVVRVPVRVTVPGISGPPISQGVPPVPSISPASFGPNQPPVVWIGGDLSKVSADTVQLREDIGSVVSLRRLGGGATTFFTISGDTWERLAAGAHVPTNQPVCAETLLDGQNLLAIRVFLGTGCGPA